MQLSFEKYPVTRWMVRINGRSYVNIVEHILIPELCGVNSMPGISVIQLFRAEGVITCVSSIDDEV